MRKLFIWFVTIFCPGIIFFMMEQYVKMIVAFALQASILGWIPAIIWARRVWKKELKKNAPSTPVVSKVKQQQAHQQNDKS